MLFRIRTQLELEDLAGFFEVPFQDHYGERLDTTLIRWQTALLDRIERCCERAGLGVKCYALVEISVDSADRPCEALPLFGDGQVEDGILGILDEGGGSCGADQGSITTF